MRARKGPCFFSWLVLAAIVSYVSAPLVTGIHFELVPHHYCFEHQAFEHDCREGVCAWNFKEPFAEPSIAASGVAYSPHTPHDHVIFGQREITVENSTCGVGYVVDSTPASASGRTDSPRNLKVLAVAPKHSPPSVASLLTITVVPLA